MSRSFQVKAFFNHWLNTVDEHSIHSPFFFDLYQKVIKKKHPQSFLKIEKIRSQLIQNQTKITYHDLGAPSPHFNSPERKIADLAATSLSPEKWCLFYHRLAGYINAKRIVELGTSMGITALYLSEIPNSKVFTFEGNPSVANIALTNFEFFERKNIELIEGNMDASLSDFLQDPKKIDFVLMDANHQYEPTMRYFEWLTRRIADKGVIIVDDIHSSEQMQRAWLDMRSHELTYGSVDLFKCGLLFFDTSLNKQHFTWTL